MRFLSLISVTGVLLALAACSEQHQETQKASSITRTAAADTSQKSADAVPPASTDEVPAGSYKLDREHASLIFRVNHLGFSNYTARFKRFDATLEFDPKNERFKENEANQYLKRNYRAGFEVTPIDVT